MQNGNRTPPKLFAQVAAWRGCLGTIGEKLAQSVCTIVMHLQKNEFGWFAATIFNPIIAVIAFNKTITSVQNCLGPPSWV